MEFLLFALFFLFGLPWVYIEKTPLSHTTMSLITWCVFCCAFLLPGWYYAKKRKPDKIMLHMGIISLCALLPMAGVFDLISERLSVQGAGVYLRSTLKPDDVVIQYGLNMPSLCFYLGKPGQNPLFFDASAISRINGQEAISETELNRLWEGKKRVFILINRRKTIANPLPKAVYNLYEAGGTIILSNQTNSPDADR